MAANNDERRYTNYFIAIVAFFITAMMFGFIITSMFPYILDDKQAEYHNQCLDRYKNSTNLDVTTSMVECDFGTQYPERLPDTRTTITIKTVQILWLGDCKILTSNNEILHASEDKICMAQVNETLDVYRARNIENGITNQIYLG